MNELEMAREDINEIDEEMAKLFESRMEKVAIIADYKKKHGLSIYDKEREQAMIANSRKNIANKQIEPYYVQFLKGTLEASRNYQSELIGDMRVAYSGVEGAFAHIAAGKMFPEAEYVSYPGFTEAYKAVERGECIAAVLPLENSYAGEVGAVMDLTFSGELYINQVMDLDIRHHLIAKRGATLDSIKTVVSHSQALSQCKRFIESSGYEKKEFANTAMAAEFVKNSDDISLAAIASDETAKIYDLEILKSDINDIGNNTTRFASFSNAHSEINPVSKRENDNFILMFTVENKAGALAQTLNIIGAHGYNMRSLRSRPMKDLQWNYYFYIEADGNINNENGRDLIRELSVICARLKVAGTYVNHSL